MAERCIGLAIRKGQAEGTIASKRVSARGHPASCSTSGEHVHYRASLNPGDPLRPPRPGHGTLSPLRPLSAASASARHCRACEDGRRARGTLGDTDVTPTRELAENRWGSA